MSFLAALNTCITYSLVGMAITQQTYDIAPSQVTGLTARMFGTWTAITATVRLVTAYNIGSRELYGLTFFTFVAAAAHFATEWELYETTSWKSVRLSLFWDVTTPLWMLYAWSKGWYL